MSCREARALIHALLDGTLDDRAQLDAHLAGCPACRGFLADLVRLDGALRKSLECPIDEARLAQLTAGALASAQREASRAGARGAALWPRFAMAAALVLTFAGGLLAGRNLWPRETVTTRVVEKPRIVVKVVDRVVEAPAEARVVKEVPVVRTRVVYRDRVVNRIVEVPRPAPTEPTIILAQGPPVKADEIVVRLPTGSFTSPVVSTELHPARIVEPEPAGDRLEAPREGALEDPTGRRIAQAPTAGAVGIH